MNFKKFSCCVLGLTGCILCGKSAALAAFKKCGAFTLSCDEIAREVSARPSVQKKIQTVFGATDRAQLAQKVFASSRLRKQLEALLHPLILREVAKRLKSCRAPVAVVETPLLFEAGLQDAFDITLCVAAPQRVLAARARKRGLSQKDFLKRSKVQWSQQQKAASADICLLNDTTLAALEGKVRNIYRAMTQIYQAK